jgi:hypothetical protein
MARQDRLTLYEFFRAGDLPTEEHFKDLIDSMLNMTDEGFRKSATHGLEISVPKGSAELVSFFRAETPKSPVWSARFSENRDQLCFRASQTGVDPQKVNTKRSISTLCLDQNNRVGVAQDEPIAELDVGGTVRCRSRLGSYEITSPESLIADGKWHLLLGKLSGCQAFEVVVGAGSPGTGRFALTHAIAINTYNPTVGVFDWFNWRRKVRATSAYSRWFDKIRLRWVGTSGKNAEYGLEVRTGTNFGEKCRLTAHVTSLWFDPHMANCIVP